MVTKKKCRQFADIKKLYNFGEIEMKITMLGTGNALVTECYNTCFLIENQKKIF